MKYKCPCGVEFTPNRYQLASLKCGREIYHDRICKDLNHRNKAKYKREQEKIRKAKRNTEARKKASLHCVKYEQCLDDPDFENGRKICLDCEDMVEEKNHYLKTVTIQTNDVSDYPLHLPSDI